jgi:SAM-dependent methyltransferase
LTGGVDFGLTAADYGRHRRGFPAAFFERLAEQGLLADAPRALDLGSGTGTIARGLAERGARVTALDRSPQLLREAQRLGELDGVEIVSCVADAERTGLAAHSFELICAGQCWHWFDAPRTCDELRRLLVPGGRVVLAAFDWLPTPGSIAEATEGLIRAHNPSWTMGGGDGRHPEWRRDLEAGGFVVQSEHFEVLPTLYSPEAWRGRIRASAGVGASLSPAAVERFDAELTRLLSSRYPGDEFDVPHVLSFCVALQ